MSLYIALTTLTEQGIKNIKESPSRLDAAKALAKKHGCEIKDFYLTLGSVDMVTIIDGPNDEAVAKFALTLGSSGNLRSTTLKAFSEDSYRKIIAGL
jgi:uncharacterized protein with GYD domain